MDISMRVTRLERQKTIDMLDEMATKILHYDLGEFSGTFSRKIYAKENSVAHIVINTNIETSVLVNVNGVDVYDDTCKHVVLSCTMLSSNNINVTFASNTFATIIIDGNFKYDKYYPNLVCCGNTLFGQTDLHLYSKDVSSLNIGLFDIFAEYSENSGIHTFNYINNKVIMASYVGNNLVLNNITDNTNIVTVTPFAKPTSLAVYGYTNANFDYVIVALCHDRIYLYCVLNNQLITTYYKQVNGYTMVSSLIGAPDAFVCVKSGSTHICHTTIYPTIEFTLRQIGKSVDCVYKVANKYYVLSSNNGMCSLRVIGSTYNTLYSRTFESSGAFVSGNTCYGVLNNFVQVIYGG